MLKEELIHYGVPGMKWGKRGGKTSGIVADKKPSRPSYLPRKSESQKKYEDDNGVNPNRPNRTLNGAKKKTVTKKTASVGRKKAKKIAQSGARASAKTVSFGAQMVMRMMQNNIVYGSVGAMFD
jgi:hypothetical protein